MGRKAQAAGVPRDLLEALRIEIRSQLAQAKEPHAKTLQPPTLKSKQGPAVEDTERRKAERRKKDKQRRAEQKKPKQPALAMSVGEFCQRHGNMSKVHFYEMCKRGEGPATMKVGRRRMISLEAAAAWRRDQREGHSQGGRGRKRKIKR